MKDFKFVLFLFGEEKINAKNYESIRLILHVKCLECSRNFEIENVKLILVKLYFELITI